MPADPALHGHQPARYDVFGRELPPSKGSGLRRVLPRQPDITPRADLPEWWQHPPHARTQQELREIQQRELLERIKAEPIQRPKRASQDMAASMNAGQGTDQPRVAPARHPVPWAADEVPPPVLQPLHATRRDLVRQRRLQDLEALRATLQPDTPADAPVPAPSTVAPPPASGERLSKSMVLARRRRQVRAEAGLLPDPQLDLVGRPPAPTLAYVPHPACATLGDLQRARQQADRERVAQAQAAAHSGRPWAGETGVSPLEHMRTMARDAATVLGRTRSAMLDERQQQFTAEAARAAPTKPPGVHAALPAQLYAEAERAWWEEAREAAPRGVPEPAYQGLPEERLHASTLLAKRLPRPVATDPLKRREVEAATLQREREERASVADKVTRIVPPPVAGPDGVAHVHRFVMRRWTDVVIGLQDSEGGGAALDGRGKLKRYAPGERDPMYSSFAADGVFRYHPHGARSPASPPPRHRGLSRTGGYRPIATRAAGRRIADGERSLGSRDSVAGDVDGSLRPRPVTQAAAPLRHRAQADSVGAAERQGAATAPPEGGAAARPRTVPSFVAPAGAEASGLGVRTGGLQLLEGEEC